MRDLISRETAKLTLKNYGLNRYMLERMERWIDAQPAVEQTKGIWLEKPAYYECSRCHYKYTVTENYCPNCGARMKGADDE